MRGLSTGVIEAGAFIRTLTSFSMDTTASSSPKNTIGLLAASEAKRTSLTSATSADRRREERKEPALNLKGIETSLLPKEKEVFDCFSEKARVGMLDR